MPEEKGLINVYVCQTCGSQIVTINREEGTTPFMIRCEATTGWRQTRCQGNCFSSFYRVDQKTAPTHEWYRPTTTGERKKLADPAVAEHVRLGGLLLRRI
jgi:ribosomal protein L40E